MASLNFSAGPISATTTASNAKASRVVSGFLGQLGYNVNTMTPEARAEALVSELKKYMLKKSRQYYQESLLETKRVEVDVELSNEPVVWED